MKSFAFVLLPAVAADSTVSKVIALLDELKGKVQGDLKTEEASFDEYSKWCTDQQTTTSYAIKDEKRVIEEQSALAEGAGAKAEAASAAIAELGPAIAGKETEMKDADKVRADQEAEFQAKQKELVEAEDMLRRAYDILKRATTKGGAFLQGSDKMREVIAALGTIVEAGWIGEENRSHVKAFLEDNDLNLLQAPQASTSNYDSKSGGILSAIDGMRDDVMKELQAAKNKNTKSRHAYEMLVQGLTNEITSLKKQLATAKKTKASESAKSAAAKKAAATETANKEADEAYLADVNKSCADAASEWSQRQEDAAAEMTALDTAKDVLSQKVVVLTQASMNTRRVAAGDFEKRSQLVSILRNLGRKFNSFGFLQAASAAQADPFEKVRGLIKNMIAKLEKQAQDEATFEEECKKNLASSTEAVQKKEASLAQYEARFKGAKSKQTARMKEIATLKGELKELAASVAEATEMRNTAAAENKKIIEDNEASAAAVGEAISVLKEFYGSSESFLQKKGDAAPAFETAPRTSQAGGAHSIIAILETAQEDFTKLFQETQQSENEQSADYTKMMQEAEVTKAKKEASILGKESELKSLKEQIGEVQEDLDATTSELNAARETLKSWQDKCANKAMSYEERKQRREAELAGLQEALTVLSADEPAGFLQRRSD